MRSLLLAVLILCLPLAVSADDIRAAFDLTYFECIAPVVKPPCVAPDENSKSTSCPECKSWRRVSVDTDVKAHPEPKYRQPNAFADDVAEQMYGTGLPKNGDGKPVSISHFYRNFEQYGWVEVPAGSSKEGTLAVMPTTAAVVIEDTSGGEARVLYSSTRRDGDVRETDLNVLEKAVGEAKFLVPEAFLTKEAEEKPPR